MRKKNHVKTWKSRIFCRLWYLYIFIKKERRHICNGLHYQNWQSQNVHDFAWRQPSTWSSSLLHLFFKIMHRFQKETTNDEFCFNVITPQTKVRFLCTYCGFLPFLFLLCFYRCIADIAILKELKLPKRWLLIKQHENRKSIKKKKNSLI